MNAVAARLKISLRPALIHLGLSALVAVLAIIVIFPVWHPGALAWMQGVDRLVLIMIGVDVVLGPLMTLIVFNPAKKRLWFDLMVIAAMQTTALLYGMGTIFNGRPAYIVYNVDRYTVMPVQDVVPDSLDRAIAQGKPGISWFGPRIVAAQVPRDPDKAAELMFSSVAGGADLAQLPEWYVPLEAEHKQMRGRLRPMYELRKINELDDAAWNALLAEFGKSESELGYFPMDANARDGAMIVNRETLEPLGPRLLTPNWSGKPVSNPLEPSADDAKGLSRGPLSTGGGDRGV